MSIRQNAARNRYEFDVDGGEALAFYRLADGVMTFTHTEVPARAARPRPRLADDARACSQDVRAQGLKVVPRCPFVADYIRAQSGIRRSAGVAPRRCAFAAAHGREM